MAPQSVASDEFRQMNTIIIGLIKDWDLMDGEAKFPLDPDAWLDLPIELVQNFVEAMVAPN
jgi:hypothetical protein